MHYGDRVQLTTDIHCLIARHKKGDQGVIQKTSPGPAGLFHLRMDDGRPQFARPDEITPAPTDSGSSGQDTTNADATAPKAEQDTETVQ